MKLNYSPDIKSGGKDLKTGEDDILFGKILIGFSKMIMISIFSRIQWKTLSPHESTRVHNTLFLN